MLSTLSVVFLAFVVLVNIAIVLVAIGAGVQYVTQALAKEGVTASGHVWTADAGRTPRAGDLSQHRQFSTADDSKVPQSGAAENVTGSTSASAAAPHRQGGMELTLSSTTRLWTNRLLMIAIACVFVTTAIMVARTLTTKAAANEIATPDTPPLGISSPAIYDTYGFMPRFVAAARKISQSATDHLSDALTYSAVAAQAAAVASAAIARPLYERMRSMLQEYSDDRLVLAGTGVFLAAAFIAILRVLFAAILRCLGLRTPPRVSVATTKPLLGRDASMLRLQELRKNHRHNNNGFDTPGHSPEDEDGGELSQGSSGPNNQSPNIRHQQLSRRSSYLKSARANDITDTERAMVMRSAVHSIHRVPITEQKRPAGSNTYVIDHTATSPLPSHFSRRDGTGSSSRNVAGLGGHANIVARQGAADEWLPRAAAAGVLASTAAQRRDRRAEFRLRQLAAIAQSPGVTDELRDVLRDAMHVP